MPSTPGAPIENDLADSSSDDEQEDVGPEPNWIPGAGRKRTLKLWHAINQRRKCQAVWLFSHLAMQL